LQTTDTSGGLGRRAYPHFSLYLAFSGNTFISSFNPRFLQLWIKCEDKFFISNLGQTEKLRRMNRKQIFFLNWKSYIFLYIMLSSPLKVNRRFGGTTSGSKYDPSKNPACSKYCQWITQRYILEERPLHNHRWENLKSCLL
jgi:hypothetical protein